MSSIKKLAGQTVWYGASSILARFLLYLLTPYLTLKFSGTPEYGKMSLVYSIIPFLNILVLFGFETAYFRYIQRKEAERDVYDTLLGSLLATTTAIVLLMILLRRQIAGFIHVGAHPEYITISACIIACDALSALPFAKLRHEGRPMRFAAIRIVAIILNIAVTYFFLSVCPRVVRSNANSVLLLVYSTGFGAGYVLIANLVSSLFQTLALSRQLMQFRWNFNARLWKEIMIYALPLTIAGFGGMINETFDRVLLARRLPLTETAADVQVGIYSGCYKLSLLISLFVQAFRMGAEPFFFNQSSREDAQRTYARVMKFFVMTICLMFLFVALYLNLWKDLFIRDPRMWDGLKIVPVLLFANMFLGIYYNLSIWYKLSHRTMAGAWITLIGAGITLIINYVFIPRYGYMASAWATFFCYGSMMLISYVWGQREYPVPYAWKKLVAYMVIVYLLYVLHHSLTMNVRGQAFNLATATVLTIAYALFILRIERKEFRRLPYIGKWM
ncbi:MAG: oligosaccharide flippase family protein [Bacteroidota bacterium]|nr:oligosaccharide flippase family protein [Bacteroidota bacterium]MDP4216457.1 oligosaccharide flippase family protein [Bacteroidota bacterium]MDP4259051.1 oligosaccharide flippase family protein [Bacteroidota bacterium]